MARYATGKYAKAISDRSGLEYRYKDMRKEWNGLLVGKDEFERAMGEDRDRSSFTVTPEYAYFRTN